MSVSLKISGLDKIQQELNDYAQKFPTQMETFMRNLMSAGIPVVDTYYMTSIGDSSPSHTTRVEVTNDGSRIIAQLIVSGEDIAFIEFGAGIFYNSADHPRASDFNFGIGTYGKGQGKNNGWYYYDNGGSKKFSRGTQMTMPVHKASEKIINDFQKIAKESFGIK